MRNKKIFCRCRTEIPEGEQKQKKINISKNLTKYTGNGKKVIIVPFLFFCHYSYLAVTLDSKVTVLLKQVTNYNNAVTCNAVLQCPVELTLLVRPPQTNGVLFLLFCFSLTKVQRTYLSFLQIWPPACIPIVRDCSEGPRHGKNKKIRP